MSDIARSYGVFQFGSTDNLTEKQHEISALACHQVRIRVISTSVNPIDVKTRMGLGFVAQTKKPDQFMPLGYDVFGVIEQIGEQVSGFEVGQHVIAMAGFAHPPGAYTTALNVSSKELIVVDMQEKPAIAGLCLAGLTALQALNKFPDMSTRPLFVNAATGGVGHLAIQIAKNLGFKVVALTSRPDHALLQQFDIDVMSYDTFYQQQRDCLLLDFVGGERALALLECLSQTSYVVTVPTLSKDKVCAQAAQLGISATGIVVEANTTDLEQLYMDHKHGKIKVHVDRTFCLQDVAEAHDYMAQGRYCGKIIITA